jgi:chromosome segregation ATPase
MRSRMLMSAATPSVSEYNTPNKGNYSPLAGMGGLASSPVPVSYTVHTMTGGPAAGKYEIVHQHGTYIRDKPRHDANSLGDADFGHILQCTGKVETCPSENGLTYLELVGGGWVPQWSRHGHKVLEHIPLTSQSPSSASSSNGNFMAGLGMSPMPLSRSTPSSTMSSVKSTNRGEFNPITTAVEREVDAAGNVRMSRVLKMMQDQQDNITSLETRLSDQKVQAIQDLHEYKEEIVHLKRQLQEKISEIDKHTSDADALLDAHESLKADHHSALSSIEEHKVELAVKDNDHKVLADRHDAHKEHSGNVHDELLGKVGNLQAQVGALQAEINSLKSHCQEQELQIQSLNEQAVSEVKNLKNMEEQKAALTDRLNRALEAHTEAIAHNDELSAQHGDHIKSLQTDWENQEHELKTNSMQLEQKLVEKQREFTVSQEKVDTLEDSIRGANITITSLRDQVDMVSAQRDSLSKDLSVHKAEISHYIHLEDVVKNEQASIKALELTVSQSEKKSTELEAMQQKTFSEHASLVKSLERDISTLENKVVQADEDRTFYAARCNDYKLKYETEHEQLDSLKAQYKKDVSELQKHVSSVEQEAHMSLDEKESIAGRYSAMQTNHEKLMAKFESLKTTSTKDAITAEEIQKSMNATIADLESKVKKVTSESGSLVDSNQRLQDQLNAALQAGTESHDHNREALTTLQKERVTLMSQLMQSQADKVALETAHEMMQTKIGSDMKRITDLSLKVDALSGELAEHGSSILSKKKMDAAAGEDLAQKTAVVAANREKEKESAIVAALKEENARLREANTAEKSGGSASFSAAQDQILDHMRAENERFKKLANDQKSVVKELQAQLDESLSNAETQRSESRDELATVEAEKHKLHLQLAEAINKGSKEKGTTNTSTLTSTLELKKLQSQVVSLQEKLNKYVETVATLNTAATSSTRENKRVVSDLTTERDLLRNDLEKLKRNQQQEKATEDKSAAQLKALRIKYDVMLQHSESDTKSESARDVALLRAEKSELEEQIRTITSQYRQQLVENTRLQAHAYSNGGKEIISATGGLEAWETKVTSSGDSTPASSPVKPVKPARSASPITSQSITSSDTYKALANDYTKLQQAHKAALSDLAKANAGGDADATSSPLSPTKERSADDAAPTSPNPTDMSKLYKRQLATITSLQSEVGQLRQELYASSQQIAALSHELQYEGDQGHEEMTKMASNVRHNKVEAAEAAAARDKIQGENDLLVREVRQLRAQLDAATTKLDKQKRNKSEDGDASGSDEYPFGSKLDMVTEINHLHSEHDVLIETVEAQHDEIESLQRDVTHLQQELDLERKTVATLQGQVTQNLRHVAASRDTQRYVKELKVKEDKLRTTEARLKDASANRDALKNAVQNTQRKLDVVSAENKQLRSTIQSLELHADVARHEQGISNSQTNRNGRPAASGSGLRSGLSSMTNSVAGNSPPQSHEQYRQYQQYQYEQPQYAQVGEQQPGYTTHDDDVNWPEDHISLPNTTMESAAATAGGGGGSIAGSASKLSLQMPLPSRNSDVTLGLEGLVSPVSPTEAMDSHSHSQFQTRYNNMSPSALSGFASPPVTTPKQR